MAFNALIRILNFRREYTFLAEFLRFYIYFLRAIFYTQKTSFAVVCIDIYQKITVIM